MDNCQTCKMVAALRAGGTFASPIGDLRKIAELDASMVALFPDQFHRGHVLVISKTCAREPFDLSDSESVAYHKDMMRVAKAVSKAFNAHKINYSMNGNGNPHNHWNVIPRYTSDPDHKKNPGPHEPKILKPEEYAEIVSTLQKAL